MTALITAVFIASLLGSTHCTGMCGAFVAFAVAGPDRARRSRTALHLAYNGGRLATYMALGAAGGLLGRAVDLGGSYAGVQRTAAALAGALMVGFGMLAILRLCGVRIPRLPLPSTIQRLALKGHHTVFAWPPLGRTAATGLLTTLLPCGWLYAFAITAAGTADPLKGAATMAAFWAGTLPMLITLGAGLQAITGPLRARLPLLTSLLLVGVGLSTIFGRLAIPTFAAAPRTVAPDTSILIEQVNSLDSSEMPCCQDHGR